MDDTPKKPRGRPKDATKRDAVLEAARRLFLDHGPHSVALDAVIARAGVSKANFYSNFADREALLEAVISREAERVVPIDADGLTGSSLASALTTFGERLLFFLSDPEIIGFERLVASAAAASPHLADRFYRAGPGRAMEALVALVADGVTAGTLEVDSPSLAAEDLLGLWQGMTRVRMTMGLHPPPEPATVTLRAARGVQLFMRLYRRPRARAAGTDRRPGRRSGSSPARTAPGHPGRD